MSRLDEMGQSFNSWVEGMFNKLSKKIDCIAEDIQDLPSRGKSEDSAPFDLQDGAVESGISDIPIVGDDQLTYITPVINVHSGDTIQVVISLLSGMKTRIKGHDPRRHQPIIWGEDRGDMFHVITRPLLEVKTRVRKWGKNLCIRYTSGSSQRGGRKRRLMIHSKWWRR